MAIEITEIISQIQGNRFIGLSVYFLDNGFEVVGCEVVKRKGNLNVADVFRFSDDMSRLRGFVSGNYPVILLVDGKGVLHKPAKVNNNEKVHEASLFPGMDMDAFRVQKSCLNGGDCYLSIGRRQLTDDLLTDLRSLNFQVVVCSLGPFIIDKFIEYIKSDSEVFNLGHNMVSVADNTIRSVKRDAVGNSQAYYLEDDCMEGDVLLIFCFVLSYVSGLNADSPVLDIPELKEMEEDNRFKRRYFRLLGIGSVALLVVLLVNFMFYSGYSSKLSEMAEPYYRNSEMLEQLKLLEQELQSKRLFTEGNDLLGDTDNAWYCDQIGASLMDDIVLERMELHPAEGRIRNDKQIKYTKDLLRIEGTANEEKALSQWIQALSEKAWVKYIAIERYFHETNKPLLFTLKVGLDKGKIDEGL